MFATVGMIFKKELVVTLRDRKTLMFMAVIPTLAIPVLLIGMNRLMTGALKKQAFQTIRIAADARTQDAYRRWVHDWVLGTELARELRVLTSPFMTSLIKPEAAGTLGEVPGDIFSDVSQHDVISIGIGPALGWTAGRRLGGREGDQFLACVQPVGL